MRYTRRMKSSDVLTVEELTNLWKEMRQTPHLRVIVSRNVPPESVSKLPRYYDKKLLRDVETWIIGGKAWRRFIAETPPLDSNTIPSAVFGVKIEFSPPEWHP